MCRTLLIKPSSLLRSVDEVHHDGHYPGFADALQHLYKMKGLYAHAITLVVSRAIEDHDASPCCAEGRIP